MHRTQILLETSQYQRLKKEAAQSNTSLAQFIRRLVDRYLGEASVKHPLESFSGALEDKECQSTNFKKFLYPNS